MQLIVLTILLWIVLIATRVFYHLNKSYETCFEEEYQWKDLWQENIGVFSGIELVLNSSIALIFWILLKDSFIGIALSFILTYFTIFFFCLGFSGMSIVKIYRRPLKDPFRFWQSKSIFTLWLAFSYLPIEYCIGIFTKQVKKYGKGSKPFVLVELAIVAGLFLHILFNPFFA